MIKTCPICKKTYNAKKSAQKYCSPKCVGLAATQKVKSIHCAVCDKVIPNAKGRRKYCSSVCCGLSQRKNIERLNYQKNRAAIAKRKEYVDWRKAVFAKDEYSCVICKAKGYLEAHHIVPWSKSIELRYVVSNGLSLCKKCHKLVHKKGG